MKMPQNEKLWIGGGVVVALVLTAGAWFGAISPQLSHASELRSQKVDADTQNQILHREPTSCALTARNCPASSSNFGRIWTSSRWRPSCPATPSS